MSLKIEDLAYNFLNLYWLRPEIAVWRTIDAMQMSDIRFERPMLDLGCGDGTFSFTYFGGQTDVNFDVYKTIEDTRGFWRGRDMHNQLNRFRPKIIKKTRAKIDAGLDWKTSLLQKAGRLSLYGQLVQHDLNKSLPFSDKKFQSIFSNVFYWIDNLKQLLKESNRILEEKGKLIVCVPDSKFKKNLIFNEFLRNRQLWARELDRGIYSNISKHCYSYSEWKSLFDSAGFVIKHHSSYLSEKFIQFWNIGLRPYSPYLIEMANSLSVHTRGKIKLRLLKEISPIISSYASYECNLQGRNCFHLFELRKVR